MNRDHLPTARRQDRIRTVTSSTFDSMVLEGEGPIVVEFMSYGCEHCRELEPVLQKVAEVMSDEEQIFRVNIAVSEDLAASYGIEGTPTLLMFLNGTEVGRVRGPSPTQSNLLMVVTRPFES